MNAVATLRRRFPIAALVALGITPLVVGAAHAQSGGAKTGKAPARPRLAAQLMTADAMRAALHAAGAPSDAAEIGVDRAYLRRTALAAVHLRSRYTLLDLLAETGLLERAVEAALPMPETLAKRG